MVRCSLVGHPVQYDLEAIFVGFGKQALEVFHGAEFGIHRAVVGYGVIRTQRAFAFHLTYLVHGHEPEYVHAKLFQTRELGLDALECALG